MATLQDKLDAQLRAQNQGLLSRNEALYNRPDVFAENGTGKALEGIGQSVRGLVDLPKRAYQGLLEIDRQSRESMKGRDPYTFSELGQDIFNPLAAGFNGIPLELQEGIDTSNIPARREEREVLGIDGSTIPARKEGGDISALSIDVNGIPSRKVVTPEAMEDAADVHQRMSTDATTVTPQEAASTAGIAKASMEAQGKSFETQKEAPEGIEKSVWQGFNDQFDLTTIGLTLMATAQNGNDLGVNLGLAMQAGRVAKTASKDKAIAKQEKDDAKARQARADLAAAQQQDLENNLAAGKYDILLSAEQRAQLGQPIQDANTKAQTAQRVAQAFKIYDDAAKAKGSLVPQVGATLQAQGVDTLLAAGFKGKTDDPTTRRLGKVFASFAESERLNGFQGDPTAKVIDHMMRQGFFRDTGWWERGNFAPADLSAQLGLN